MSKLLGSAEICEANLQGVDVTGSTVAARTKAQLYRDVGLSNILADTTQDSTPGLQSWKINSIILQEFQPSD